MIHRPAVVAVALAACVAAAFLVAVEVRQEREFRRLIAVGEAALAEDQLFVAIESFSGAIAFKPASMLAHLRRGEAYHRRGELRAALRDLGEAARLDETAPQPLELLGDVNAATRRHDQAAAFYGRYLQLDNSSARVLYKQGLAYIRNDEPAKAVEPLTAALSIDGRLAEAHYLLGVALRSLDRPDEALTALSRAIALDADLIEAREERAALYAARGRMRESFEELEAIAALEPSRPERLVALASAYARAGRSETAVLTLRRAAERHPDSPIVATALGRVWLDSAAGTRDPDTLALAVQTLRPIAARNDAPTEAIALYGRALLESGRAREAERVLQQAVRRAPVDPLAYRDLAEAARRLGHGEIVREAEARYRAIRAR